MRDIRPQIVLVMVLMASIGCMLTGTQKSTPTPIALQEFTATPSPTTTPSPTATTQSNSSSSSSGASGGNTVNLPPCYPRTDWPAYTVRAGDTLGSIASRTSSTVSQLSSANCLANANVISVGQVIRVPNLPVASPTFVPTPTTINNSVVTMGELAIDPIAGTADGRMILVPGATVLVEWAGAEIPSGSQVEFILIVSGTNQIVSLGIDTNFSDGIHVQWTVPAEASGWISAGARTGGQMHNVIISPNVLVVTQSFSEGVCEFQPFGTGAPHPVYFEPNPESEIVAEVIMEQRYRVIDSGGTWSTDEPRTGQWLKIEVGETTGWLQDYRGALYGDCDAYLAGE